MFPPRPRQARDEPGRHGITNDRRNDGDRLGRLRRGPNVVSIGRHDDVDLETDQLGCKMSESFSPHLSGGEDEGDVLPLDIAELAQPSTECLPEMRTLGDRGGRKDTDPRDFSRRLRLGGERHKNEAESENDREPDQPHGHLGGGCCRESSRTPRRAPEQRRRSTSSRCGRPRHRRPALILLPQKAQKEWCRREDPPGGFFDPCVADAARRAYHTGCNPSSREEGIPMKLNFRLRLR